MSRASRRREERTAGPTGATPGRNRAPFYIMGGSVLAALLILAIVARPGTQASHHPVPRIDAQASQVMPAARYASSPAVADTYRKAAEIVSVLDGLYCYCLCHDTFGHYSLLDCFESDHAASCDVCLREAEIAYEMNRQGRSLDQIRQTIDGMYGST